MKQNKLLIGAYFCLGIGATSFIVFFVVILVHGEYWIASDIDNTAINTSANIGDFIGGVIAPFWSLAGVFLYFSALRLQSQEIANQVQEMSENKRLLAQQQFETTFFNLLNTQQNIKNNIDEYFYSVSFNHYSFNGYTSQSIKGGNFFARARDEIFGLYKFFERRYYEPWNQEHVDDRLRNLYHLHGEDPRSSSSAPFELQEELEQEWRDLHYDLKLTYLSKNYKITEDSYKRLKNINNEKALCAYVYLRFFYKYENSIGHYCRHLYNTIKFLDSYHTALLTDTNITSMKDAELRKKEEDKIEDKIKSYFSFIQSSLSSSEMFLLFYNMLLFDKAETLYVKYDLFENLRKEKLIYPKHSELIKNIKLKSDKEFSDRILEIMNEEKAVPQL